MLIFPLDRAEDIAYYHNEIPPCLKGEKTLKIGAIPYDR